MNSINVRFGCPIWQKIAVWMLLICASLFLIGCASSTKPGDLLIGRWQRLSGTLGGQIGFAKDGTFTTEGTLNPVQGGHYCVLNDETIAIQINSFDLATACKSDSPVYQFNIQGNQLTLKNDGGGYGTYQRLTN